MRRGKSETHGVSARTIATAGAFLTAVGLGSAIWISPWAVIPAFLCWVGGMVFIVAGMPE